MPNDTKTLDTETDAMDAIPSLGELGKWELEHHSEVLLLGDPRTNRGVYPACLTIDIGRVERGKISGQVTLQVADSSGKPTAAYGPGFISGATLDDLRAAAIEWAHAYVASIARDLGLIPRAFEKEPTP